MEQDKVKIAWVGKHFGEEPPLTGSKEEGAGGIFFSACNLSCAFCQNYQISQQGLGEFFSVEELAEMMLKLQAQNALNIDLVTPTIWHKPIKKALKLAKKNGLILPVVWNSNGYEKVDMLKEMDGLVDIYLPDFKYGIDEIGLKYSRIKGYSSVATFALQEMFRQVGNFSDKKGLIVRHLILPNNLENTFAVLDILAKEFGKNLTISLMSQYYPLNRAQNFPEINRQLIEEEFEKAFDYLRKKGFENGWVQELGSAEIMSPDFTRKDPFAFENAAKV